MNQEERFEQVFTELRQILEQYSDGLNVKTDEPDSYYLEIDTGEAPKPADFFAGVQIRKRYVSYYFIPACSPATSATSAPTIEVDATI